MKEEHIYRGYEHYIVVEDTPRCNLEVESKNDKGKRKQRKAVNKKESQAG